MTADVAVVGGGPVGCVAAPAFARRGASVCLIDAGAQSARLAGEWLHPTGAGILAGSFLAAVASKTFRLEMFADRDDMLRHMGGAALMGFGGVMSAGCTVGQGLTGVATLAVGSLLAFGGIVLGAVLSVKVLIWRMERAALDHGI